MKKWLLVAVTMAMLSTGYSHTFDTVLFDTWVGATPSSADNRMGVVFNFSDGHAAAFGYLWNASETVSREGTLAPISADISEAVLWTLRDALTGFDFTYTDYGWGIGIDSITYNGHEIVSDWVNTFAGFWWDGFADYFDWGGNLVSGEAPNGVFEPADLGAGGRVLADGFWDAWTNESVDAGFTPVSTPVVPLIPEPASLALLGLAVAVLTLRRR